jgi:hypothetical protein
MMQGRPSTVEHAGDRHVLEIVLIERWDRNRNTALFEFTPEELSFTGLRRRREAVQINDMHERCVIVPYRAFSF